jgi:hypothetical protein
MKDKIMFTASGFFVTMSIIGILINYLIHSLVAPFGLGTILFLHDISTAVFNIGAAYCIGFVIRWMIFDKPQI